MKYVIDIPQSYYEQIQEYPQRIWIGRDIIKPFEAELEKIKAEIEEVEMFYLYSNEDLISKKEVFGIIDKRISELKGE